MLEKIWRSVDPDFFTVIEDLLEDTIQSVSPSFIVSNHNTIFFLVRFNKTCVFFLLERCKSI